jgi:hypothetical protein
MVDYNHLLVLKETLEKFDKHSWDSILQMAVRYPTVNVPIVSNGRGREGGWRDREKRQRRGGIRKRNKPPKIYINILGIPFYKWLLDETSTPTINIPIILKGEEAGRREKKREEGVRKQGKLDGGDSRR